MPTGSRGLNSHRRRREGRCQLRRLLHEINRLRDIAQELAISETVRFNDSLAARERAQSIKPGCDVDHLIDSIPGLHKNLVNRKLAQQQPQEGGRLEAWDFQFSNPAFRTLSRRFWEGVRRRKNRHRMIKKKSHVNDRRCLH